MREVDLKVNVLDVYEYLGGLPSYEGSGFKDGDGTGNIRLYHVFPRMREVDLKNFTGFTYQTNSNVFPRMREVDLKSSISTSSSPHSRLPSYEGSGFKDK